VKGPLLIVTSVLVEAISIVNVLDSEDAKFLASPAYL
jgi:hypothetical protein